MNDPEEEGYGPLFYIMLIVGIIGLLGLLGTGSMAGLLAGG